MKTIHALRRLTQPMLLSWLLYTFLLVNPIAGLAFSGPERPCDADTLKRATSVGSATGQGSGKSSSHTTYNHHNSNNGTSTVISYDGKIAFTDDEKDIKSITPGGYFRFSKTTFGNKREIHIQSASDGRLTRRYYVGKSEEAYEPGGRQWLEEMLPEIIATTGIGAEDRVKRLYAKSGLKGVLAEIEKMESNNSQAIYYSYLMGLSNLKDNDLRLALGHAGKTLTSDYEKGRLLRKVAPRYLQSPKVAQEYVNAVTNMNSDYEKSRLLSHVLQTPNLNNSSYELVIPVVARIASDYEQANVLKSVLANPSLSPQAHKEVIALLRTINSDYEKNRVLSALMANPKYMAQNFEEVLLSISTMKSDYEKSRALTKLLTAQKLSAQHYLQLLPVISTITSSYDKCRTLQKVRNTMPADNEQVRSAYFKAAKTITSDHDYRRAIAGLEN